MKAIITTGPGTPDVMTLSDVPEPTCAPEKVRVRVEVAGVNFIDTYQRSGVYKVDYPFIPGLEGAGTVVETGAAVAWARVGDRVAWASTPASYAEQVILGDGGCFAVPEGVPSDIAAAAMMQALTAHYLCTSSFALKPGHTALVHAGAGGVGLLLTQMAVARGARVITTVSSEEKAALSRAAGADVVIRYDQFVDIARELPDAVRAATGGRGVDVVYDGVGKSTFDGSLASLAVRGALVLFGGASGQVPAFDLQRLNAGGSLSISRPTLKHFIATANERAWRSGDIFGAIADGTLDVRIGARFPLADAAEAHRALEGRATTGKVLLIP
ncbi:quinone oxidoreductase family protein [Demequina lutea]|uniref:NADPH2:quinone reductase n=1 Tax=Demequina lutea TaxID=431489 RepID=A0A7Y9ZAX0_9MICO|nr:quinone oxidoreductase [Demequina lutea]NYI41208.1 NADPH2:quinone reductase [Demequina lutea]